MSSNEQTSTPQKRRKSIIEEGDDDTVDFNACLKEAQETDLSDLERIGCFAQGRDLKNNLIIVILPFMAANLQEKPEIICRKLLLLFVQKTQELASDSYSVVYAHTSLDVMSQYPIIYKFYSILPRNYKKNLQRMYILHPNVGIRMFFEFARIFLSQKFYQKLTLLESILDFQRIVPPTILSLPLKFLKKEDEDMEIKYFGKMPSLNLSFDPILGTTKLLEVCAEFLRVNNGVRTPGIFRVSGDDGELNLARIRLQYAYVGQPPTSRVVLSEKKNSIIIGDVNLLYTNRSPEPTPTNCSSSSAQKLNSSSDAAQIQYTNSYSNNTNNTRKAGGSGSSGNISKTASRRYDQQQLQLPTQEQPMSIVVISNIHSVAQIFKVSIRELPEPLISDEVYREVMNLTRRHDMNRLESDWDIAMAEKLAALPMEQLSTLVHIVRFLREVAAEQQVNNMGHHNLSIVFAPTIFRSETDDPMRAVMELKLSQVILEQILIRKNILDMAVKHFKTKHAREQGGQTDADADADPLILNNPMFSSKELLQGVKEMADLSQAEKSELTNIASFISPAMAGRMFNRGRKNNNYDASVEEESRNDEDDTERRSSTVSNEESRNSYVNTTSRRRKSKKEESHSSSSETDTNMADTDNNFLHLRL